MVLIVSCAWGLGRDEGWMGEIARRTAFLLSVLVVVGGGGIGC
jgi:hypothetical protein